MEMIFINTEKSKMNEPHKFALAAKSRFKKIK